jgi:hypothetical protein
VHHVRVALDDHVLGELDAADAGDAAGVVAAEVEELHVLGTFLFVGQQLGGEGLIFREGNAAPAGAGDRPHGHRVALEADQDLRRGANDVEVLEVEIEHVRRRIERAQRAVQRHRAGGERFAHALRQDDLHDVAFGDVALGLDHRLLELRFTEHRRRRLRGLRLFGGMRTGSRSLASSSRSLACAFW